MKTHELEPPTRLGIRKYHSRHQMLCFAYRLSFLEIFFDGVVNSEQEELECFHAVYVAMFSNSYFQL